MNCRRLEDVVACIGRAQALNSLLLSYLLFERGFTREMIDMGYEERRRGPGNSRLFAVGECPPIPGGTQLTA